MTKCTCPPTSPFLWRGQSSSLDVVRMQRAASLSSVSTKNVNKQRRAGVEPMAMTIMSNKKLAHTVNPRAKFLQTDNKP